jgi:heat shock protein HtpX
MNNGLKTAGLMAAMVALMWGVGQVLGGPRLGLIFLIFGAGVTWIGYWFSDTLVLKMHRAVEATPDEMPQLHGLVERLAQNAGLPTPRIYIIRDQGPNAFATGRNPSRAVVAFTDGILSMMNTDELEGVTAHELAHIKNRDLLISTIAATMAGVIMGMASMAKWTLFWFGFRGDDDNNPFGILVTILVMIFAPIAALFIRMMISRSREYLADETGAGIAGSPFGLASALQRLQAASKRNPFHHAHQTASHLYIVNPFFGGGMANLFRTHPPIEDRVKRLRDMGNRDMTREPAGYMK